LDDNKKLGIMLEPITKVYVPVTEKYSLLESIPVGIKQGFDTLGGYISDFKYVFTKEGAESLGGFGTIGSIFPPVWDWEAFWSMTAFLSIILAFMNILPIPALDGGHVLFLLYEVVARRKPSEKFLERSQMVGMIFLIMLLIVANGNDIIRLFK
ncbi:MAG: site-2 protease family protein, partial [Bacteroidales bacterium]